MLRSRRCNKLMQWASSSTIQFIYPSDIVKHCKYNCVRWNSIQYFLTRTSGRTLLHVRVFALQIEWLFRPLSWDSQRWAQNPARTGLFRHICLLRVLRQTWPTHPPSALAELLPVMKIFYLCLDITLQKLIIITIIIIMMMMMINKYQLLVSNTIEC